MPERDEDPTQQAPPREPGAPPARVGRYEVRAVLGQGAFGRVYHAFDPELRREVAVKVPHPHGLTPATRERFLREARAAAAVQHPNVLSAVDVATDGDLPFIVMRYVAGGTLADLLARRSDTPPQVFAATVVRQVARGVAAAHAAGFVHLKLCPRAVLWDEAGRRPLVSGFEPLAAVEPGVVLGTLSYMAPEQARGDAAAIGPQSDVYALGMILYRMLAGEPPYTGTAYEVMIQAVEGNPKPPSAVRPGVDPTLDAVCLRAMAADPAARFPSAAALADALGEYLKAAAETPLPDPTVSGGGLPPPAPLSPEEQTLNPPAGRVDHAVPPHPGSRIGPYDVRGVLGEGACGRVYLGYDTVLGEVAVKVPHAAGLTAEGRDRFLRVGRALAAVRHPNVITVYEIGIDGELPFLVMPYLPAGTLADRLAGGAASPKFAAAAARQLALGTAAAHAQGVVHLDLKPQNVLWDPEGRRLVITDFDLARVGADLLADGGLPGTPAYMSPEHVRGDVPVVGPRSDVYALGVILYRMLAGVLPYTGTAVEVMVRACEGNPRPPSAVNPGADPALEAICLTAMAVDPAARFRSAAALADALGEYLAGREDLDPPPAPADPLPPTPLEEQTQNTPPVPAGDGTRAPAADGPPAPPPGPARVGRYEVRALLRDDWFTQTYLAHDPVLGRDVAVTVPHAAVTVYPEQFGRATRAPRPVHHPNVCPVYDAGVDYSQWFWVTPHVPGGTVADLLARTPAFLPVRTAAGIVRQAARGVAAAHAAGATHGRLTAHALLWDEAARRVLVTGFELARYAGAFDPEWVGAVLGVPAYTPPESLRGTAPVDGRLADVYALGVLLYRLLTGMPPFEGTGGALVVRIAAGNPRPPSAVRPGIDPALDAVCLRAMAADPAARYPTAAALAAALRPFARGG